LALRNFAPVGFNPEGSEPSSPREMAAAPGREAVA
jgi:hypothetical protein